MGLDNPLHLAFLLVLLLLVFGAKRLPEVGRSLGHGLRGFKDAIGGESHAEGLAAAEPAHPVQVVQQAEQPAPVPEKAASPGNPPSAAARRS